MIEMRKRKIDYVMCSHFGRIFFPKPLKTARPLERSKRETTNKC